MSPAFSSPANSSLASVAMQLCKEKYPMDTEFYMQAVNDISAHLIHKVFPTAKSISHSYYLRAN